MRAFPIILAALVAAAGCSSEKKEKPLAASLTAQASRGADLAKAADQPPGDHARDGDPDHPHDETPGALVPLTPIERENIGLKTVAAAARSVEEVRRFPGVIKPHPDRVAVVTSRTSGRIVEIHAKIGERVAKGQDLIEVQSLEVQKLETDLLQAENRARGERSKVELDLAQAENRARAERSKLEVELAQAENKLRLAQAEADRNRALVGRGIGARKDLIAAENQLQASQNEIAGIKRQLEIQAQAAQNDLAGLRRQLDLLAQAGQAEVAGFVRQLTLLGVPAEEVERVRRDQRVTVLHIPAPLGGMIVERPVTLGQIVETTTTLFKIVDDAVVIAEGDVFEDVLPALRLGQPVRVTTAGDAKRVFEGKVSFIHPVIDPEKRTARIWAELRNVNSQLKQDMFAQLHVVVGGGGSPGSHGSHAVAIPVDAVIAAEGEEFVFVEREGGFARVAIATGARNDQWVEVKRGLKTGEKVVTDGRRQVYTKLLTVRSGGAAIGGHAH